MIPPSCECDRTRNQVPSYISSTSKGQEKSEILREDKLRDLENRRLVPTPRRRAHSNSVGVHCVAKTAGRSPCPSSLVPLFPSAVAIIRPEKSGTGADGRAAKRGRGAVRWLSGKWFTPPRGRAGVRGRRTDVDESLFTIPNPFTRRRTIVDELRVEDGEDSRTTAKFRWTTTKCGVHARPSPLHSPLMCVRVRVGNLCPSCYSLFLSRCRRRRRRRSLIAVRSFVRSFVQSVCCCIGFRQVAVAAAAVASSLTLEEDTCQSDVHLSLNANPANLASLS